MRLKNILVQLSCLSIFLLTIQVPVFSQQLIFNHLTTNDGLVSSSTRIFIEDYKGFIWIGTEDGLQRYDGNELVLYRHIDNDSTSLSSNFISCLFEDSYHNLWISTLDGGLTLYNREKNNFRTFCHNPKDETSLSGDRIRTFYESHDKKLFVGFQEGDVDFFQLIENIISIPKLETSKIKLKPFSPTAQKWVQSIVGQNDNLFIGSNGSGLYSYNLKTGKCVPILRDTIDNMVHNLLLDSKDRLWIGTWGHGMYIYDLHSKQLINHRSSNDLLTLNDDHIDVSIEDAEHNIWIGTDNGLSIVDYKSNSFETGIFKNYFHSDYEPTSLLGNIIKGIYKDNKNRIWVGSYYGGVNVYDKNAHKFQPIIAKSWLKNSLSNNNVFAFAEDSKGNLWVGTDGGGIDFLEGGLANLYANKFQHIEIKGELTGRIEDKVKCMAMDSDDNLYIGYWRGGLIKLNTKTLSHKQYISQSIPENGPSIDMIIDLDIDENDDVWLGTFNGGLNFFDRKTEKFKHYREITANEYLRDLDKILSICIDSKKRVWVSRSGGGLNLYNPSLDNFSSIKNDIVSFDENINYIFESSDGALWLGTVNQGLKMYHPDSQVSRQYKANNGLPDQKIYSIQQDNSGNLWIATSTGLSHFNTEKEIFTNYYNFDGLQSNEFNHNSSFKFSDGTLLFGGINGFNAIDAANIKPIPGDLQIELTKFWLNNIESPINDPQSPLTEDISLTDKIELKHNQNSFSIGFTAFNFSFSNRSEFAYMLEGFDTEWKYIGHENKATFTNLDPGTYYLHLKASNRAGYWSGEKKKVQIHIKEAIWQTTGFRLAVLAMIILIIYIFYRVRLNFLINQRSKLLKMVQERTFELTLKNDELRKQKDEIGNMNNEILAQNEELTAQNDQINIQREELFSTQEELKQVNSNLENMVKERTDQLESTINHLDKMVLELDRFVYSASHELSAPLRSIAGLVNISKMEKDNHRIHEYLQHIDLSVQKMETVIKSILSYSRNTHLEIELDEIPLFSIVEEVISELNSYSLSSKITFINKIDRDLLINSDTQRLKIILQNIIGNSIKYSDPEKPKSFVTIECIKENNKFKIVISDNGQGIKKDRINKIFNMYYRGTTKSQGAGLGLFIVKEMVHRMDGQINVKSKSREGTTFEIVL